MLVVVLNGSVYVLIYYTLDGSCRRHRKWALIARNSFVEQGRCTDLIDHLTLRLVLE
jgi:hypothetical protein